MNPVHEPDAERLRQRARVLARRQPAAPVDDVDVLDFTVAGHRCAIEVRWVREVRPLKDVMSLPLVAQPSTGLVPLRGRMLPVIDIPGLVAEAAASGAAPGLLLVLGRGAPEFGVGIAAVHGLRSISPGQAERRSGPLQGWRPDVVRGVLPEGHVLLDGERLLSWPGGSSAGPGAPAIDDNR